MADDSAPINLTNHFLIAMPGLADETFAKSVVYLCEHSERGALGLIVNKPTDIKLQNLFDKVELPLGRTDLKDHPVFHGGPVQTERGFVLHEPLQELHLGEDANPTPPQPLAKTESTPAIVAKIDSATLSQASEPKGSENGSEDDKPDTVYASTMMIPGGLEMTTSRDVLEALSTGAGPSRVLISLGYSAWAKGQLESELGENSWLSVHADPAIIFETPVEQRYDKALSLLGLQAWMLSPDAGHA
jgi:putative transcriptional regulator